MAWESSVLPEIKSDEMAIVQKGGEASSVARLVKFFFGGGGGAKAS